jgi:hypothetical protein
MEKSFNDCTLLYLEKTFGLVQVNKHSILNEWINLKNTVILSDFEKQDLQFCQELLIDNVLHWNEQELSLHFIGPIFSLARFTSIDRKYNLFAERSISANIQSLNDTSILLSGKPDGLIASGYREPESPYFCFQEYKKHREPAGEPEGQCLASLLVGQKINTPNDLPMYGCIVIGRDWYFMILQNNEYCLSRGYDATTEAIFELFAILKSLKVIIEKHLA